ncbi:MAG: hypothetical protein QMC78_02775 [Methanocellales archaeon]|nr:hypothetical protein [Methanocellales archaeon]
MKLRKIRKKVRVYFEITGLSEIARRYFVMNAFDGALTMLGIIIGAFVSGVIDHMIIISTGIAASLAMGISGVSGAYMTEKAERIRDLKELESALLIDLKATKHGKATRFAWFFAAFVDGASPALAAMLVISPFFLTAYGLISEIQAFQASLIMAFLLLFGLGAHLARTSDESMWKYGIQMLIVGLITAVACIGIALFLGR